ncbi:MAG: malonyl-CoA decarboxylase domain-containing protein [Actinomycetota bacterium]
MTQWGFLDRLLHLGAARRSAEASLHVAPGLPERDLAALRTAIRDLLARRDEAGRREAAAVIADAWCSLSDEGVSKLARLLASEFGTDRDAVDDAITAVRTGPDRRAAETGLRDALAPASDRLLRAFLAIDDGLGFLVARRGDLLRLAHEDADCAALADAIVRLIGPAFEPGLLTVQWLTWETPAALLARIIEHEAVHPIVSWDDLRDRLDDDRRAFAVFHPAMPAEPLAFTTAALTHGMPAEIPAILDPRAPTGDPDAADTVAFYSISACCPGLAGVNVAGSLIKHAVAAVGRERPGVSRFVTLSPMPGFRSWLETVLADPDGPTARERELLPAEPERVLARLTDAEWSSDEAIRPGLLALGARYLTTTASGRVIDRVGNFHLANGAAVERVNFAADPSDRGRFRSFGLMVNYRYEPDRLTERAEHYASEGTVATSSAVRDLLGGEPGRPR